jgi:hypothetical protein
VTNGFILIILGIIVNKLDDHLPLSFLEYLVMLAAGLLKAVIWTGKY